MGKYYVVDGMPILKEDFLNNFRLDKNIAELIESNSIKVVVYEDNGNVPASPFVELQTDLELTTVDATQYVGQFNSLEEARECAKDLANKYGVPYDKGFGVDDLIKTREVVKDMGNYLIVKYYANTVYINDDEMNGSQHYGDIYLSREDVLEEHPGTEVMEGFGFIDKKTAFQPEGTPDWFESVEEVMEYIKLFDETSEK